MISIVCPTISGREHWLERCQVSYCETTELEHEFIVVRDYPACNQAWNVGILEAQGDFIHLTADDIEAHPRWAEIGLEWIEKGILPCTRVLNSDGTLQSCGNDATEQPTGTSSDVARVPFFPREILPAFYPILHTHLMGDYWITHQARKIGWPTVVVREFCFTHHFALEGRLDTLSRDLQTYNLLK